MKGPALLALLPDIPGHCLLALLDVSPDPLSDRRLLDMLENYQKKHGISVKVRPRSYKKNNTISNLLLKINHLNNNRVMFRQCLLGG